MGKKICICNQKGGASKTTTAALLALYFADQGATVQAIDCDPQGGLSRLFNVQGPGLFEFLTGTSFNPIVSRDVFIVPADHRLDKLAYTLGPYELKGLGDGYDITIIDTPPTVQGITRAAAILADKILIPADISEVTEGPTRYTLDELKKIKKSGKVVFIGKEPQEGATGYKAQVFNHFYNTVKREFIGFIPYSMAVRKVAAGASKLSPALKTIISEIVGNL